MWELEPNADYVKKLKKFNKRHRCETTNAHDNLAAYLGSLRGGMKPQQIIRGYIHREGGAWVRAVDESGPNNPKKAIRLYFYPDEDTETLHVITIGDKNSQNDDVKYCQEFVASLRAAREGVTEGNYSDEHPEKES